MLMKFEKPDQKFVRVAGTTFEMFLPKANEVQECDFGKGRSRQEIEQFLKLGFGTTSKDLKDSYTVTYGGPETAAGEKATRIALAPKSQEVANMFQKFELWISDATGISVQMKIYEKGGNYTVVSYPNMKLDPNISESEVRLNLPKGVTRNPVCK